MQLDLIQSTVSLIWLVPLLTIFTLSAKSSPYGAVSLPCILMLTSIVYFYVMPVVVLASGDEGLYGMYILNLEATHTAVGLYACGAGVAFLIHWRVLNVSPSVTRASDRPVTFSTFVVFWAIALVGIIFQIATGRLNMSGAQDYQMADSESVMNFAFLTQFYNLLVPLVLVALIKERFSLRSIIVLLFVLVIFLQAGFRFRIMLLLAAVVTSYAWMHQRRIGFLLMSSGLFLAVGLSNVIGALRRYGQGLALENLNDVSADNALTSFGGEFGIVYVLDYTARSAIPYITIEPWVIGVARLVPSALWPNKPYPDYLRYFTAGATQVGADRAGIMAPQQVELLLQFGWIGLPILSFCYFSIVALLIGSLLRQSREARIAGCALVPSFFGYYMQTRGYFAQTLADSIFMFLPLFFLHPSSALPSDVRISTVQRTTQERPQL